MKKILLLGGSAQQVIAIETAKKLGYYTILCDYLPDNPGQYVADKFYLTSTTDRDAILEIAKQEKIDGILAYASDPAAPTAAYVAEKMNLPGNSYESVKTLCNKDLFRKFLRENGFATPMARGYASLEDALQYSEKIPLPVIIKPVDSSGSKGVTVVEDREKLKEAMEFAFLFSRAQKIIIEEFIEKKHKYLIGGDVFVQNGEIVLWGLLNCHRDNKVNVLVPVGKSYPLEIDKKDLENVKETLRKLVSMLHIRNGAMNVELVIDKENKVWPIDIGPRNGGNMIPDLLSMIFNIDVVEMTIKLAMGENCTYVINNGELYYATYNLHSSVQGTFESVMFSDEIEKYIVRKNIYVNCGDPVFYFDNAAKALGIVFFKFDDYYQMKKIMSDMEQHICIKVK